MGAALRAHWPHYLIEAAGLGLFMLVASTMGTLLEHPASPVRQAIQEPLLRRLPMGLAMGLTAIALIYSPLGQRSGAHFNPATTTTFFRLGKVAPSDWGWYVVAQFVGGVAGMLLAALLLREWLAHPNVHFVATRPGMAGVAAAFATEIGMTFALMLIVLAVSNSARWRGWTGLCAGALVATYITLLAPLSGMSLNPARSVASATLAWDATALWVYLVAPLTGMLLAAELYVRLPWVRGVVCAKLHHPAPGTPCHFRCSFGAEVAAARVTTDRAVETTPVSSASAGWPRH